MTGQPRLTTNTDRGYTLLEVLVVMAIISMIVLAMPLIPTDWTRSAELRSATTTLAGDIRKARSDAGTGNEAVSIELMGGGSGYILQPSNTERPFPSHITMAFTLAEANYTRPDTVALTFHPTGVTAGGEFVLTSGTVSRTVTVNWPSGAVQETLN